MPPRSNSVVTAYVIAEQSIVDDFWFMSFIDQSLDLANILQIHNQIRLGKPIYYPGVYPAWDDSHICPQPIHINAYFAQAIDLENHTKWDISFVPFTFTTMFVLTKENNDYLAARFDPHKVRMFVEKVAQQSDVSAKELIQYAITKKLDWQLDLNWRHIPAVILNKDIRDTIDYLLRLDESKPKLIDNRPKRKKVSDKSILAGLRKTMDSLRSKGDKF